MSKKKRKEQTDGEREPRQEWGGCSELQNSREFRVNFFAISIICTLVLVSQNAEDGVKARCAFQVGSTRTETSANVPRPPQTEEPERGRTLLINPTSLWRQRAGGPIKIPRVPH